jgi:hypothetical protein
MSDVFALSIGRGPQVSVNPADPGSYSGGGTALPHEFLPDNHVVIEQGTNVANFSAEASAEGAQHSMAGNGGIYGGAGIKKPSKMRPGNTLTPR